MGIPYYFRKIVNDFPDIINSKNTLEDSDIKINNLFLDFNCCIHSCSNELKSTKIYNSNDEFEKDLLNFNDGRPLSHEQKILVSKSCNFSSRL